MKAVRAKKFLGQHFLTDESIASRIVDSLQVADEQVLEIGPGMGVLTKYLIKREDIRLKVVEIDRESVAYLHEKYTALDIIEGDFLRLDLQQLCEPHFSIIGNFPYNISSQILFKVFENRDSVSQVVGMFQKEVAERVTAKEGNKTYGILSVLLSAYYDIEYLFTVSEYVFNPPPKVKSAVIRMKRNEVKQIGCDEALFVKVVKAGFNQRRKTLHNALRQLSIDLDVIPEEYRGKRAEQLSVDDFIILTKAIERCQ